MCNSIKVEADVDIFMLMFSLLQTLLYRYILNRYLRVGNGSTNHRHDQSNLHTAQKESKSSMLLSDIVNSGFDVEPVQGSPGGSYGCTTCFWHSHAAVCCGAVSVLLINVAIAGEWMVCMEQRLVLLQVDNDHSDAKLAFVDI